MCFPPLSISPEWTCQSALSIRWRTRAGRGRVFVNKRAFPAVPPTAISLRRLLQRARSRDRSWSRSVPRMGGTHASVDFPSVGERQWPRMAGWRLAAAALPVVGLRRASPLLSVASSAAAVDGGLVPCVESLPPHTPRQPSSPSFLPVLPSAENSDRFRPESY